MDDHGVSELERKRRTRAVLLVGEIFMKHGDETGKAGLRDLAETMKQHQEQGAAPAQYGDEGEGEDEDDQDKGK
jgi:hypothetical protein